MQPYANPDVQDIHLKEGMRLTFESGAYPPHTLFGMTAGCSAMLGGKPVRCTGFLPGVSLLVHVLRPAAGEDLAPQLNSLWSQVQRPIEDWIEVAEQFPCLRVPNDDARITLALDRLITLEKGVVQIDAFPTGSGQK
ncbi:hypothetical protein AAKU55_005420 [Oxalobacteraceae bacterium GrIS 1.11]